MTDPSLVTLLVAALVGIAVAGGAYAAAVLIDATRGTADRKHRP